jgi:hypothetical protein
MMALNCLDKMLARRKMQATLIRALDDEFMRSPIAFFRTIVMPLLPKEAKLTLAHEAVMEMKSLIAPGGPAAPAASQVIDVPAAVVEYGSGRRFGKTLCLAAELLDRGGSAKAGEYGWVAPTYKVADRRIEAIRLIAEGAVEGSCRAPSRVEFRTWPWLSHIKLLDARMISSLPSSFSTLNGRFRPGKLAVSLSRKTPTAGCLPLRSPFTQEGELVVRHWKNRVHRRQPLLKALAKLSHICAFHSQF